MSAKASNTGPIEPRQGTRAPPGAKRSDTPAEEQLDGRAVLTLAASCAGGALEATRIVVEVPADGAPSSTEREQSRLRHRRGTLVEVEMSLKGQPLRAWLESRQQSHGKERLALGGLDLEVGAQGIELSGDVSIASQDGRFVFRGTVQPQGDRFLQLKLEQLSVFGPATVAATEVAETLFRSAGAQRTEKPTGPLPLARLVSSTEVVIDVLSIALARGLAPTGWRLPRLAGSMLEDIELGGDSLRLVFVGPSGSARPPRSLRLGVPETPADDLLAALDQDLHGSGPAKAVEELTKLARESPQDQRLLARLMQRLPAAPLPRAQALELAAELREHNPQCADTWLAEANIRARGGRSAEAARCYRQFAELMAKRDTHTAELEARLAACAHAPPDDTGALQDVRRALQLAPKNPRALHHAARLCAELRHWDALAAIRQQQVEIATSGTDRAHLQLALGELYREHLGRPHRAVEHYRAALAIQPSSELALSGLSACCVDADDLQGAIDALDKVAAIATSRGDTAAELEAVLRAAALLDHAGQPEQALQRLERTHAAGHSDPQLADRLVELLTRVGRHAEAAEIIRQQLQRQSQATTREYWERRLAELETAAPQSPAAAAPAPLTTDPAQSGDPAGSGVAHWTSVAETLRRQCSDHETGERGVQLRLELARVLDDELARPADALAAYAEAATLSPDDPVVLERYADAAYRQQEWNVARETYSALLMGGGGDPESAETHHRLGVIEEALGHPEQAERLFARALECDPGQAETLAAATRLAAARGDDDATFDLLTRLAETLTMDEVEERASVRERLGAIHLRREELERARSALEGALSLDPRRISAVRLLRRACSQAGDHTRAVALTAQLLQLSSDVEERAALLHEQAEILATHLNDEEQAIDCLLRAHDLAPSHEPTLWRLIDYYWSVADLDAVTELGEELARSKHDACAAPDLRHARLAMAVMLTRGDLPAAAHWLRAALGDPQLARRSLLELAQVEKLAQGSAETTMDRADLARSMADLIRSADESGKAWQTIQDLAQSDPRAGALAGLVGDMERGP